MTVQAIFHGGARIWAEEELLDDVVGQMSQLESNAISATARVADRLHRRVQEEAVTLLPGRLSQIYLQGLLPPRKDGDDYVIELEKEHVANRIENGSGPYDMRMTLLGAGSDNVKVSQDGNRYRAIPFAWSVPNSKYKSGKNKLGQHPKHLMKGSWKPTIVRREGGPGGGRRYAASKGGSKLPGSIDGGTSIMGYRRKTQLDKGLQEVRERNRKGQILGTSFMTFRTISTSETEGWFHPGFPQYAVIRKTFEKHRAELEKVAKEALSEGL